MRTLRRTSFLALVLLLPAGAAGDGEDATREALRRALGTERFESVDIRLSREAAARVAARAGRRVTQQESFRIYRGRDAAGAVTGEAMIVNEIGKYRPITFLVATRPDGRVSRVEVLAYREAWGGAIRSSRFLSQFAGKTNADPLQTSRDIQGITGASLSVRSATVAVRKVLAILEETRRAARERSTP